MGGRTTLQVAALVGAGVVLHGADALQAQLGLDAAELAALVDAGVLLEVELGAGLVRYAFAATVPGTVLIDASR